MDEKQIEDFAIWIRDHKSAMPGAWYSGIAEEAAKRFSPSPEDRAVIEAAEKWLESREHGTPTNRQIMDCSALRNALEARRKSLEPKPRYEEFELGIRDRRTDECFSLPDRDIRKILLALLNQAHETERG